jgi:hypothetical protein
MAESATRSDDVSEVELELELARVDDELNCLRAYREHTLMRLTAAREKNERAAAEEATPLRGRATDDDSLPSLPPHSPSGSAGGEPDMDATEEPSAECDPDSKEEHGSEAADGGAQTTYQKERARIYWLRVARGNQCTYALRDHQPLPAPLEQVRSVALCGGGCVCVLDDGSVKSCGVPLKSTLGAALLLGQGLGPVRYVAASGYDASQWYLLRADGSYAFGSGLPKRLKERLTRGVVTLLVFGPSNSYFGRFESGRRFWSAETLSVKHFHPRLQQVFRAHHVLDAWLGPAKGFFVRYVCVHGTEHVEMSGLPLEMQPHLIPAGRSGLRQMLIDYSGSNRVTFFVRYTKPEQAKELSENAEENRRKLTELEAGVASI